MPCRERLLGRANSCLTNHLGSLVSFIEVFNKVDNCIGEIEKLGKKVIVLLFYLGKYLFYLQVIEYLVFIIIDDFVIIQ